MKVSVSVSLQPGYRSGIYALDIEATWNDGDEDVATRSILMDVIHAYEPEEDTDLRLWSVALMRQAAEAIENEFLYKVGTPQAKLTLKDFKPRIALRVGIGRLPPSRPR